MIQELSGQTLRAWMVAAKITSGPIFRPIFNGGLVSTDRLSDRAVAEIVKPYAKRTGLDPTSFSAHSLRAGFLTSAAQSGASAFKMMDVSRHKRMDTIRGYIRDSELFRDHAGMGLL
jgi:integrase